MADPSVLADDAAEAVRYRLDQATDADEASALESFIGVFEQLVLSWKDRLDEIRSHEE